MNHEDSINLHLKTGDNPIHRVFVSYSHRDREARDQLAEHLSLLERRGLIETWCDMCIYPGELWRSAVLQELDQVDLILLLVSSSFIASDFCYSVELQRAMERHHNRSASVVPILVRPCDWHEAPFAVLQVLPRNGKPISTAPHPDAVWTQIAEEIRQLVEGGISTLEEMDHVSKKKADVREIWHLHIEATIEEMTPQLLGTLTDTLQKVSGDARLTIQQVRPGSVCLELDVSDAGSECLGRLIQQGTLCSLHGYRIIDFHKPLPEEGSERSLRDIQADFSILATQLDLQESEASLGALLPGLERLRRELTRRAIRGKPTEQLLRELQKRIKEAEGRIQKRQPER